MVQNILVTGGSGIIGSNLVDKLILAGNKVFVIDDLSTGLLQNQNSEAHYFNVDLCEYIKDSYALIEIIERNSISIVFHLAASADVNLSLNNPETVYNVNVLASISLVRACIKAKVTRFIFASTSAVYGEPSYFALVVNSFFISIKFTDHKIKKTNFLLTVIMLFFAQSGFGFVLFLVVIFMHFLRLVM